MAKISKPSKDKKVITSPFMEIWSRNNYLLLYGAIGLLLLGYFLMAQSPWDSFLSLSLSPIILLIGYIILIPITILYKSSSNKKNNESAASKG
jgi:hypothetical protein